MNIELELPSAPVDISLAGVCGTAVVNPVTAIPAASDSNTGSDAIDDGGAVSEAIVEEEP